MKREDLFRQLTHDERVAIAEASGWRFLPGATVGDALFAASELGRGGHLDDLSDEGARILSAISPDDESFLETYALWEELAYTASVSLDAVRVEFGGTPHSAFLLTCDACGGVNGAHAEDCVPCPGGMKGGCVRRAAHGETACPEHREFDKAFRHRTEETTNG